MALSIEKWEIIILHHPCSIIWVIDKFCSFLYLPFGWRSFHGLYDVHHSTFHHSTFENTESIWLMLISFILYIAILSFRGVCYALIHFTFPMVFRGKVINCFVTNGGTIFDTRWAVIWITKKLANVIVNWVNKLKLLSKIGCYKWHRETYLKDVLVAFLALGAL